MSHRIMLMFEHPTCNDVVVDVHLPLPDPITENIDTIAARVKPACPICKEPMHYIGWGFSDTGKEEDKAEENAR